MDMEMELIPHHLRLDINGTEARDGVDPQKVHHKYGSSMNLEMELTLKR